MDGEILYIIVIMKKPEKRKIPILPENARKFLGSADNHLREICRVLAVAAVYRDAHIIYTGERTALDRAQPVTEKLLGDIPAGGRISKALLTKALQFPDHTLPRLKMFLTRLGYGSRMIVTGDITQIDLKPTSNSGLVKVAKILKQIQGIGFIYLNHVDVLRHPLVQRVIEAFDGKRSL